jgi:hypothetical protein
VPHHLALRPNPDPFCFWAQTPARAGGRLWQWGKWRGNGRRDHKWRDHWPLAHTPLSYQTSFVKYIIIKDSRWQLQSIQSQSQAPVQLLWLLALHGVPLRPGAQGPLAFPILDSLEDPMWTTLSLIGTGVVVSAKRPPKFSAHVNWSLYSFLSQWP